jgi:UTP--glucose-1-phosphate uridylyltransferase
MQANGLELAEQRMRERGEPEGAIRGFASAYRRLAAGEQAFITSNELEPVSDVPGLEELSLEDEARALGPVAVIKLNGGLATTMGLRHPKSLVEARDGRSFLDIITGQTRALRSRLRIALPLLLMDSEATEQDTLAAIAAGEPLNADLPADFLQSMIPKLDADSLAPVSWPKEPALEWCPPGHGDVYGALARTGLLERLLEGDMRYAMISNADNLGATPDPRIAAHVAATGAPFLMEVVEGTAADRKGGHIARRRADGMLVLRETAQTPPDDEDSFRDYKRWRYYNTNNLWINLEALAEALERNAGVFELPLIVNRKTVDPRDSSSTEVLQLESAMGAAISSFADAQILRVPRTRFAPVKTTDDLLLLRSDVYSLTKDMHVEPAPERADDLPLVELDPAHYKLLDAFEARFPAGPPSLREAQRLIVRGDVTFGSGVIVRGDVEIAVSEPEKIADGTVLGPTGA